MTKAECAGMGGRAAALKWADNRARVIAALNEGQCLKRAAHIGGVSYRSARRYRRAL